METGKSRSSTIVIIVAILVVALWLRVPFIRSGLPYFYDEDEAHHYNRIVAMVKRGEFNPESFLKPSLHFYLRMPVVAAGFFASVRAGEVRSIKEVVTKDPFGLADYSFSAFPQRIAKFSRAYSTLWSLALVALAYLAGLMVTDSRKVAGWAALLVAVSPPLVMSSATIGVDGIVCVLALATSLLALRFLKCPSDNALVVLGLVAGLTIGTKYNAAPIAVLPLAAAIAAKHRSLRSIALALVTPILGFIVSTPYLFSNLPLFLDHVAYEVWHYGVEGHEGHMATPGLPQAAFYVTWLSESAVGFAAMVLATGGIILLALERQSRIAIFLLFPLLYFLLMISQKANFTRNMHILIPYLAVAAAYSILELRERIKVRSSLAIVAVSLLLCAQPVYSSFHERTRATVTEESRVDAGRWLSQLCGDGSKTAIAGSLQFEPRIFKQSGITRVDFATTKLSEVISQGADRIVVGPAEQLTPEEESLLSPELVFHGDNKIERVVKNPEVRIYKVKR